MNDLSQLHSKCSKCLPIYEICISNIVEETQQLVLKSFKNIFLGYSTNRWTQKYVSFPPFIVVLEKKHFLNIEPFTAGITLRILTITAFHHQLQLKKLLHT